MNKFTPGPWRIEDRMIVALKEKQICEVPGFGLRQSKSDIANSRLIAAAPLMYEALKKLSDCICLENPTGELISVCPICHQTINVIENYHTNPYLHIYYSTNVQGHKADCWLQQLLAKAEGR